MAVINYTGLTVSNPSTGIQFTKVTDSNSDWSGVTNSTYFYDKSDKIVYQKDNNGSINNLFSPYLYRQLTGVTISNTVTETSILTSGVTIPANYFSTNKILSFDFLGIHSATANPNIQIRVKIDGTTILDTGSVGTANSTDNSVELRGVITCRTIGVSGIFSGQGNYREYHSNGTLAGLPRTTTFTLDTTISHTLDITFQWGTANASNSITITDGNIKSS